MRTESTGALPAGALLVRAASALADNFGTLAKSAARLVAQQQAMRFAADT